MGQREGVSFEVIWEDQGQQLIVVEASNGRFSGHAEAYATVGELARVADTLAGFPSAASDVREVVLGAFEPKAASGGARLMFFCRDASGHATIEVELVSGTEVHSESARFYIDVEPAAVEGFVKELRSVGNRKEVPALLQMCRQP